MISRREALIGGLATLGATLINPAAVLAQEHQKKDFYFAALDYKRTRLGAVLNANQGMSVGLEGLMQGRIDAEKLAQLQAQKTKSKIETIAFMRDRFDRAASPLKVVEILKTFVDQGIPRRVVDRVHGNFQSMFINFGLARTLQQGNYLEQNYGLILAKEFLQKGVKVYGMDSKEQIQKIYAEIKSKSEADQFGLAHDYQRLIANKIIDQAPDAELREPAMHYLAILNGIEQLAIDEKVIKPRDDKPKTMDEFRDYFMKLTNADGVAKQGIFNKERTDQWVEFLGDKTPVMIVCAGENLHYAAQSAKQAGKSYEVSYFAPTLPDVLKPR